MSHPDSGVPQAPSPIGLLARLIRNPTEVLLDTNLSERGLSDTLALVWRLYILIKLGELFPWRPNTLHAGLLVCGFIFARPLASFALKINVPLMNGTVRLVGGRSDRAAAYRALTCCFILPNPFVCAYVFSPQIDRYFGPIVATFVLYGICGVVATFLDGLATSKAYGLSRRQGAGLVAMTSLIAAFFYFQIPFYLSDQFSPKVVAGDADLTLLEFRQFPIDSSVEGSAWLKRMQLEPFDFDTSEIMHALKQDVVPDKDFADRLDSVYASMAPFRSATWYDKSKLTAQKSEFPLLGDSTIISVEYSEGLRHYLDIFELRFSTCLSEGRFDAADSTLSETLRTLSALGKTNMGLVYAVIQSVYSQRMAKQVGKNLSNIHDPHVLRRFAVTLALSAYH